MSLQVGGFTYSPERTGKKLLDRCLCGVWLFLITSTPCSNPPWFQSLSFVWAQLKWFHSIPAIDLSALWSLTQYTVLILILGQMYILIWNMKFALIWRYHLVWNVAGFFIAQLTNSYIFTVLTDNSDSLWSYKYSVFLIFNNKIDIMIPKFKRRFEFFYKLHPATSDRFNKDKHYHDRSLRNNFDFLFKLINVISNNLIKHCYNLRL